MFTSQRLAPLILATFTTFVLFLVFQTTDLTTSLRHVPQVAGLGRKETEDYGSVQGTGNATGSHNSKLSPYANPKSVFVIGTTKPVGSKYSKTVVIPKLESEDTNWIQEELGDLLHPNGALQTALYTVDNYTPGELHPPKNKGHEVMVYLTYIIDHYEDLPDVSIFMHSHRYAWHNNDLLDQDAAQMIRYLSAERVTREGYMNLRCHWDPGCPSWLHPGAIEKASEKQEEVLIGESWAELFPLDPIPTTLAQPCCAQFALSKERIQALPLSRYIFYRDWLLRTSLSDYFSGRVWEYLWQYVFTGESVACPAMHACYCDGYGVCFGGADEFNEWFDLRYQMRQHEDQLNIWRAMKLALEDGSLHGESKPEVPEQGRDKWLEEQIKSLREQLDEKKKEALHRGLSARNRAEEVGRPYSDGDGF